MENMAESREEIHHHVEAGNGICERGDDDLESELPKTFEADLNLILVFLSLFSLPNEECTDMEEEEKRKNIEDEIAAKACVSRLQRKRREINEAKLVRRPTQNFRTTRKRLQAWQKNVRMKEMKRGQRENPNRVTNFAAPSQNFSSYNYR